MQAPRLRSISFSANKRPALAAAAHLDLQIGRCAILLSLAYPEIVTCCSVDLVSVVDRKSSRSGSPS
jgi:hypothetical protein